MGLVGDYRLCVEGACHGTSYSLNGRKYRGRCRFVQSGVPRGLYVIIVICN